MNAHLKEGLMSTRNQGTPQAQWLRMIVHLGCLLPLILLGWATLRGELGFNPVETALQRTGRTAVICLLLSLAATPVNKILKRPLIGRLKKPFGLYAALYALLHFAAFALWDYRLNFSLIGTEIIQKPFILIGTVALVILGVLAATSVRFWRQKLGKWWARLHRLAYLAGVLVVAHFLLAVKGDLLSLQGNYAAPLIAAGTLFLLFILRIPTVERVLRHLAGRD
jgi:methionine sulfoxide reductase heme-binding subunit